VDKLQLTAQKLKNGVLKDARPPEPTPHTEILNKLLQRVDTIDFRQEAEFTDEDGKLNKKHFVVITIDKILDLAKANNWGLCKKYDFIYLYNGAFWSQLDESELEAFLGKAAQKMGVSKFDAHYHRFRDELLKQFMSIAHLPTPEQTEGLVLVNLKNGTVEINPESDKKVDVREPKRTDFLTYQLPFRYDKGATAPRFKRYLDEVLPDKDMQKILAEYIGYVFIRSSTLKLEKALILLGSGGNGKSVFFDTVNHLLGDKNVSTYTLQSLTNQNGYYRAKLANRLVNYASEINGNMETSLFKQLVSGEPVEARLPYGEPFILKDYAKLIFNCNELPSDVEHTNAFFRRFMIVPFDVTIPEAQQDKQLAKKIIQSELSGVFNWVLDGLQRVLQQKDFTQCDAVTDQNKKYRKESDSVQLFISERGYKDHLTKTTLLKELYGKYKRFCEADGYRPTSKRTFSLRLENAGYHKERITAGMSFYIVKQ
jgi:putative DNA primase/helicase